MFSDPALVAVLTLKTVPIVWLGGFLGGVASGAAGFAYGVVATAIWLHAISPLHATMLVVSGGLIIQSSLVYKMRRTLDWPRLAPFGGWVGWMIYGKLDERRFQQMFAGLLVVSGLLLLIRV
jgi:uncharacterized membrane protein YfcA